MIAHHRLRGRGSDLAVEVSGPDVGSCLQAAVRGFAEAVAGGPVPDALARTAVPVVLDEPAPPDLLVALMDELILLLDSRGLLAVDLTGAEAGGGRLRGRIAAVELASVDARGDAPKAATWHGVRLEPSGAGWRGAVTLDL